MNWETVDWVSVWLGLALFMGILLLIRFVQREKAWIADHRKDSTANYKRLGEAMDEAFAKSANRAVRLDQVHDVALEMQKWALPKIDSADGGISAVKVVEYSSRLLAITDWETESYDSEQEEGEGSIGQA